MEVHKSCLEVLHLPHNLAMEVYKIPLPPNLHMEVQKVLRLPRKLNHLTSGV